MKTITFTKSFGAYQANQIATFPAQAADRLIATGVAKPHIEVVQPANKAARFASKILKK